MDTKHTLFPGPNDTVASPTTPEALQDLLVAQREQREFEDFYRRTQGYVPGLSTDELGVPYESVKYASSKCKTCWGKGYKTQLVGPIHYRNGETQMVEVITPVYAKSGKILGTRLFLACDCQDKGYKKARLKAEEVAIAAEKQST